jgi:hypothetical protein
MTWLLENYDTILIVDIDSANGDKLSSPLALTDIKFDNHVKLTNKQLDTIHYKKNIITLRNGDIKKQFKSANGFTVRELFKCILKLEKIVRLVSRWLEKYIDCMNIFFEGLHLSKDGSYEIVWCK